MHFEGEFEKGLVVGGGIEDVDEDEEEDVEGDEEGGDGEEFEVGDEAGVDHFEVAGFVAGEAGGIVEG